MQRAILQRSESKDVGTFGIFRLGSFTCYSGELSWADNQPNVSSIPPGRYICRYTYSPRFKRKMYEVMEVKGRAGIRIHSANFMGNKAKGYKCQLNGCIAFGMKIGVMDGQTALLMSVPAVRQIGMLTDYKPFILEIV